MKLVSKYRREILTFGVLAILYFVLRLPHLTLQPIFADEAIYVRWAQVMRAEPTLRFLPQSDGKTPLFMWAMIPLFKFIHDPLFAGRFLSVLSGFFTLLGVFFLARRIFGSKVALWSSFLYIVTPYTVFFDRMALVDSMLVAFTIWIVYLAILVAQKLRLDLAMILGYLLGGGILSKTPGMLNFLILPVSVLGFRRFKNEKNGLLKLLGLWLVAIVIGLVMYNILRLGPQFHLLSSRNQDYLFSPYELIGRPLDPFIPHLHDMSDWFPKFFSWPVLILIGAGLIWLVKEKLWLGWIVFVWALIPMLLSMAFLKTFTARYLLTSVAPLLIFAGLGAEKISNFRFSFPKIFLKTAVLLLIAVPTLYFDYLLLVNPQKANLPKEERKGYFEDWTAGYGFPQIAGFLIDQSKTNKVVVGTEGFFGTLPDGLQIYLDKSQVSVVPSQGSISAQLRKSAKDSLTFFVGNKNRLSGAVSNVVLIQEYPKAAPLDGTREDAIILYRVLP